MRITISLSLFLLMLCLTTSQLVHAQFTTGVTGQVFGYKTFDFTGESLDLTANGGNLDIYLWNDQIHSIRVPQGYQVILHGDHLGAVATGEQGTLLISQDWVAPKEWHNRVSSVQVSKAKYISEMRPGNNLYENERLQSANGRFQLRGTPNGDFVIEEIKGSGTSIVYSFPLGAPWDPKPEISTFYFNPDCNVCINSTQNKNYCATNGRDNVAPIILNKCQKLVLTDYGKLELRTADGIVIWTNK